MTDFRWLRCAAAAMGALALGATTLPASPAKAGGQLGDGWKQTDRALARPSQLGPGLRRGSETLNAALAAEQARAVPAQIARDAFLIEPAIESVAIAPDGGHVAWLRIVGEEKSLWLQATGGGAPRKLLRRAEADEIFWSHDGQWLFLVSGRTLRMVSIAGELGSGLIARLGGSGGLRFAGVDPWQPAAAIVKEELRVDGRRDPVGYRLWRIGRGGTKRLLAYGRRDLVDYAIAPDGRIAFAKIVEGEHHAILARTADGRFRTLARCVLLERCDVIGTTADGRGLFLSSDIGGDLRVVMRIDPDGRRTILHRDPAGEADLDSVAVDPVSGAPMIAGYRSGTAASYGLTDAARRGLALLARVLPGDAIVDPTPGPWLVRERDARVQGGRWRLFDPRSGRLTLLLDDPGAHRLAADRLATTIEVAFPASDGMTIHGLLTVPAGRDLAHVPLVAAVHGGPWSHDTTGYSATTQLLANRGYAVFRPQFRGSTGFGRAYMFAAKGDFGDGRVQRDIEDGVRWLLARGVGDPRRVAISGASFGGYSTLQALSNGSGLFRVGVAIVPPTDFGWVSRWVVDRGDIGSAQGIPFATTLRLLGLDDRDPAVARRLAAQSPFARVAAMRTPLLIIAAGKDERVPIRSVVDYAAQLALLGRDASVVVARKQPHAPDDPMARRAYLYLLEDMFARHLGGPPAAVPGAELRAWIAAGLDVHPPRRV